MLFSNMLAHDESKRFVFYQGFIFILKHLFKNLPFMIILIYKKQCTKFLIRTWWIWLITIKDKWKSFNSFSNQLQWAPGFPERYLNYAFNYLVSSFAMIRFTFKTENSTKKVTLTPFSMQVPLSVSLKGERPLIYSNRTSIFKFCLNILYTRFFTRFQKIKRKIWFQKIWSQNSVIWIK